MTVECPICKAPSIGDETHCGICGYELPREHAAPGLPLEPLEPDEAEYHHEADAFVPVDAAYEDRTQLYDPYTKESVYRSEHQAEYEMTNQSTTAAEYESESLGEQPMQEYEEQHDQSYDGYEDHSQGAEYAEEAIRDEETDSAQEPEEVAGDRFDRLFKANAHSELDRTPLPEVGIYPNPATLTVIHHHQPVYVYEVDANRTIVGRYADNKEVQPDLDVTEFDENVVFAHNHCCVYRQNKNYTLYVLSNAGTQLNQDILELGERRRLEDGDIIVLSGVLAIKFDLAA